MDFEKIIGMLLESPEMLGTILPPIVDKYKKPVYAICGEILRIMEDYANADEYFAVVAKTKRKQFDAYVGAGFSESQAMSLMVKEENKLAAQLSDVSAKFSNKKA